MTPRSIKYGETFADTGLIGWLENNRIRIQHTEVGFIRSRITEYTVPVGGLHVSRIDEGRSAGGAALGAMAGAMLTGGLGALAGAAIGGSKKHTLVARIDSTVLVFEVSTKELQKMVGLGAYLDSPEPGPVAIDVRSRKAITFTGWLLIAVASLFVMARLIA